jgi:hypothetical protein
MAGGRKRGGQPGNLNALKHGFYSKQFKKGEVLDLEEEIGMMRVVTRRLLKLARGCIDMKELINVLGALGLASSRVAGLMKTQKFIGGNVFDEVVDEAIEQLKQDWKIREVRE